MQLESRDAAARWDILKAARMIQSFIEGQDRAYFDETPMCHFAVIAQVQVIGEATKRLWDEFRQAHPTIPWREMTGRYARHPD